MMMIVAGDSEGNDPEAVPIFFALPSVDSGTLTPLRLTRGAFEVPGPRHRRFANRRDCVGRRPDAMLA